MSRELHQIVLAPMLTEKAIGQQEDTENKTAVFKVARDANKLEIKSAVEELFKVKVDEVRVINMRGKSRRVGLYTGRRANWKKAYVTLKEGEIDFFRGI